MPRPKGRSGEAERLRSCLVDHLVAAHPTLADRDVAGLIDETTTSTRGLSSLLRQVLDHQHSTSGRRTAGFCRLLWAVHAAGATEVALVVCGGCGATPKSICGSGAETLCTTCFADRHRRACSRCGAIAKVAGTDDDAQPLCRSCHTRFVAATRAVKCASCGTAAPPRRVLGLVLCHPCEVTVRRGATRVGACSGCAMRSVLIARDGAVALCRACATVHVSGEIARIEPGLAPELIAEVLDRLCSHRGMLGELAEHLLCRPGTLVDPYPEMPAIVLRLRGALCDAGAVTVQRWACSRCGDHARRRVGALCLPCHRSERAEVCAGCDELKPLARRGPDGESWCARCATVTETLFESCAHCHRDALPVSRDPDGPLCGRCTRAGYAYPKRQCARCGRDARVAAKWPDGPVCHLCYQAARRDWSSCHRCGEWRITPARDEEHHPLCTACSGLTIDLVCPSCGEENGHFTATQCPRCFVHDALVPVLSNSSGHVPARFASLHEVLTDAMGPEAADKWLTGTSAAVVRRMVQGEVPVTHDTLDRLRLPDGRDRHRMLRALLVTAGVLPERNETTAGVEALIERDLDRLTLTPADRTCLRHYAHFELVRKLRRTQERQAGARSGRNTATGKWKAAVGLAAWLGEQDVTLSSCTQGDIDRFRSTELGRKLTQRVAAFVNWGRTHGHLADLQIVTEHPEPRYDQLSETRLLDVAAELLRREEWDLAPRVAGLLVIMFGLTLTTVIELRCSDIAETADGTELSIRGFVTTLPVPVADLAHRLADRSRRPGSSPDRYLLPGKLAGRPISQSAMNKQLARIGFPTMLARNAARRRLVSLLDPDVMRRVTDVSAKTANDLHAYYAQPSLDRLGCGIGR